MSVARYPSYKEVEVDWLRHLPAHWNVLCARRLFDESRDAARPDDEQLSATQRYGVIPQRLFMEMEDQKVVLALSGTSSFKRVKPDDFVISLRSFQGGIEHSRYGGCVSPAYTVLRANRPIVAKYWAYALKCSTYISALQTVTAGIREGKSISYSQFGGLEVPVPSLDEQAQIAGFLDRETAKIDALIAEQEKLLALLAEKRQATISHAVTRGLDANVPMKDSGIPWLGDVPAHWRVTKCGRFLSILSGFAFPSADFDRDGQGTRLLRGVNVSVGTLRWEDVVYWERSHEDGLDEYELKAGDLVIGMDRPLIAAGVRVAKVTDGDLPCLLLQRVALLRTRDGLETDFLMHCLSTSMFVAHFAPDTTGVSVPHISPDQIGAFVVAIPPVEEQRQIVEKLDRELTRLAALRSQAERAVELLREHRGALITAAVTGQIDVRTAAA